MRPTLTTLKLTAAALVLVPAAASAQTISNEGAQQLAQDMVSALEEFSAESEGLSLEFSNPPSVTPDGSAYAVVVPELVVEAGVDAEIVLPTFDASVAPRANGHMDWAWDYPSGMTISNPTGGERLDITFSSVGNTAWLAPEYGMLLGGDITLEDFRAVPSENVGQLTIERIDLFADSVALDAPDTYDNESEFEISNLNAVVTEGEPGSIQIGSIRITNSSDAQRMDIGAEFNRILRGQDPESPEFTETVLEFIDRYRGEDWIDGLSGSLELNDLAFASAEASGSLRSAAVVMEASELSAPAADVRIGLEVLDATSPLIPPPFAPVAPSRVALDISALDVPLDDLEAIIYNALDQGSGSASGPKGPRKGASGGSAFEALDDLTPEQFLAVLLSSDAEVQITDLAVEAPIGFLRASGIIEPDASAVFSAIGNIRLVANGLPDMIAFAQQFGGDVAQVAGLAAAISAMGRDETTDEGDPVKVFDLELTQTGQILLNGNDMSAMFGMFQ